MTTEGLKCLTCGDLCVSPREHLAPASASSTLLHPDTPCERYVETNKWDRRWRVMHCYVGEGRMRYFVDDMGPDDDYKIGGIDIPSFTTRPDEMNTVAECLEIATAEHDEHHEGYVRKRIPAATAAQWAMELVEQADFTRRWRKGQSVYGPTGFTQRDTDRIK